MRPCVWEREREVERAVERLTFTFNTFWKFWGRLSKYQTKYLTCYNWQRKETMFTPHTCLCVCVCLLRSLVFSLYLIFVESSNGNKFLFPAFYSFPTHKPIHSSIGNALICVQYRNPLRCCLNLLNPFDTNPPGTTSGCIILNLFVLKSLQSRLKFLCIKILC